MSFLVYQQTVWHTNEDINKAEVNNTLHYLPCDLWHGHDSLALRQAEVDGDWVVVDVVKLEDSPPSSVHRQVTHVGYSQVSGRVLQVLHKNVTCSYDDQPSYPRTGT